MQPKKPRVALIGLSDEEVALLAPLCGEARSADSWTRYRSDYALSETDVAVVHRWDHRQQGVPLHSMALAPSQIGHYRSVTPGESRFEADLETFGQNTERQISVAPNPPEVYGALASELASYLNSLDRPPPVLSRPTYEFVEAQVIVETTSAYPVVFRHVFEPPPDPRFANAAPKLLLALAECPNPAAWFRAFLTDVHETDRERVPHAPPRLAKPEDWHTPAERRVAEQIRINKVECDRLKQEAVDLEAKLLSEAEKADAGPKQAIWADGQKLADAVADILRAFGFTVEDMDALIPAGAPKREDLRLTHPDLANWEALVEVKGYSGGTRTNDSSQIVRFQKRYIQEERRQPGLTLWVTNAHRHDDPSARPARDDGLRVAAENIDAVHVQATDLYRLWARVADSRLDPADVVNELRNARPGLWEPPNL